MSGKHVFNCTVEVPMATTNKEAVNLGQVKDLISRYNLDPVRVTTTTALTGTYTAGVLALDTPLTTLDGITLSTDDAILVKDQLDKSENGVYVYTDENTLTRRTDFAESKVILNNTFCNVMEGDLNGDTRWTIVSDGVLTVGTSSFTFIKDIDVAEASVRVAKGTITGDGATTVFSVAHNFNLAEPYAYMLMIRDTLGNNIMVDHVPTTSNESNSITMTFTEAPALTETFKVFILGLE